MTYHQYETHQQDHSNCNVRSIKKLKNQKPMSKSEYAKVKNKKQYKKSP